MEKSLTTARISPFSAKAWIVVGLAIAITVLVAWLTFREADPYIQDVLALPGNATNGQAIFQANCAVCHGLQAKGDIGPSLWGVPHRKSKPLLIKQVISGKTPPMPKFQPNPQEMADLLEYLETL